jgi:predicted CXXCH cytochrome family protein
MMMVRTDKSIGMRKVVAVVLTGLLSANVVPVSWGANETRHVEKSCLFTNLLENPSFRDRYRQNLAKARFYEQDVNNDNEAMYGSIVKASIVKEDGQRVGSLDSFSAGCITCHDGIVSRKDILNFRNDPKTRMQMISGKHPIGMNYENYTFYRDTLKKVGDLNPNLVLVGGKVSCVTCHDPFNPEKNHLALKNSGKDLCKECHLM